MCLKIKHTCPSGREPNWNRKQTKQKSEENKATLIVGSNCRNKTLHLPWESKKKKKKKNPKAFRTSTLTIMEIKWEENIYKYILSFRLHQPHMDILKHWQGDQFSDQGASPHHPRWTKPTSFSVYEIYIKDLQILPIYEGFTTAGN